jgi:hypothetical protein
MDWRAGSSGRTRGIVLWIVAAILTVACFTYQDQTGPTYPLTGQIDTAHGEVGFLVQRSQTIGRGLPVVLLDPVPEGVGGWVEYRRYRSHDEWARSVLRPGEFEFTRRGRSKTLHGVGAELPSLQERAGKYELRLFVDDGVEPFSITADTPILARYKAEVPRPVLLLHILAIFASMTIALRTVLEALRDGAWKRLLWASVVSLLLGGFVLGPWVQWYAFGVWWAGIPYGHDWTDNKVVVELVFWLIALYANRGARRSRSTVYLAGLVTLAVYFIPHSIFGSEFDYRSGSGHGTAG